MKPSLALLFSITIFLAPVNSAAAEGNDAGLALKAGFGCKVEQGKLVCGKTNKNDDDDDDDDDHKPKKKAGNKCEGEISCPAGYVVLDKPNKYGACCEPKEGQPAPATKEAEKCKFGMIGTPPNDCHCPEGTDFQGYKGCVKKSRSYCSQIVPSQEGLFDITCSNQGGAFHACSIITAASFTGAAVTLKTRMAGGRRMTTSQCAVIAAVTLGGQYAQAPRRNSNCLRRAAMA